FAREQPPSPLQHFWTLAVEEQFYIVWPVVLGLVVVVSAVVGRRTAGEPVPRLPIAAVLLVVVAVSLWWSVTQTATDPTGAYFSTLTRAWELAVGAMVAVAATPLMRVRGGVAVAAGWIGLFAIVIAGNRYSPATPFPGYAAALPVGGTALVIGAGIGG